MKPIDYTQPYAIADLQGLCRDTVQHLAQQVVTAVVKEVLKPKNWSRRYNCMNCGHRGRVAVSRRGPIIRCAICQKNTVAKPRNECHATQFKNLPRPTPKGIDEPGTKTPEELREWARGMWAHLDAKRAKRHSNRCGPRPTREEMRDMKLKVIERDGRDAGCFWCGTALPKRVDGELEFYCATLEHIVPLYLGGKHERSNCTLACVTCNSGRPSDG